MATSTSPLLVLDANGAPRIEPSISSRWTFDFGTSQRFAAQHDVILVSAFEGGPANVLTPHIDLQTLREQFDPENLQGLAVDLASYLKSPSFDDDTRGAYRIYVLRLGQPTGATLTLQDSAPANVLTLTSDDVGTYVNKVSAEVASGTITGKRLTFRFRQEVVVLDNLKNAFQIAYTGNASAATMTITRSSDRATRLQTALTSATDGSINLDINLTQDAYATIQQLVTYINGQNGYLCTMDPYGAPLLPTYELDATSAATIRTPVALLIHYVGAGSAATMTTTATALTTTCTGASADNLAIDLDAAGTDTLGELVAYINGQTGKYTCTLGPNADAFASCHGLLATVSAQDIRTTTYSLTGAATKMKYVAQAALGSIIYAINTKVARVTAARVTSATTAPANLAQTFLAGGTNPTPTLADWLAGLDIIAQEDLVGGLIFPVTTDPIMQDAVMAWILEQHTNSGASYRGFFATGTGVSTTDGQSFALGLNSTYASGCMQSVVASTGITELPPLYPAAMICGAAAGALPTQPITQMVLRARALPAAMKFAKATRELLEDSGLCVLREDKGVGVVLALALTTSLSADRIDRILSESMARDVIEQRVRLYVKPLIPKWAMWDFMPTIAGAVINALDSLEREGILSKGIDTQGRLIPAYKPPTISLQGGLLRITLHVLIGGEIDHILISGTIAYQQFELTVPTAA